MSRHPLSSFLLLAFALSIPFYLLLNLAGAMGPGMRLFVTGLMWMPALAAFWVLRGDDWFDGLGLRRCDARWLRLAYLIPLGYGLAVYLPVWLFGWGEFSPAQYLAMNERAIGLSAWPDVGRIALMLLLQASAGFVLSLATALGEELGWRGFLQPRLQARLGFVAGTALLGLIWAAWHYPVLFWMNYHGDVSRPFAMTCFTISLVGMSFVYAELRERTGSVWPAVFLHASHNTFITLVFSGFTVDTGKTGWYIDEFGIALAVVSAAMTAIVLFQRRRRGAR